jgi:hypothetical protein
MAWWWSRSDTSPRARTQTWRMGGFGSGSNGSTGSTGRMSSGRSWVRISRRWSGIRSRISRSSSTSDVSPSGPGTSGMGVWCSTPASSRWNDADMLKMARPCWMAVTRRVAKLPPSRSRSTK